MQAKYFLRYTFALNLPHLMEVGKSRNQNLYKLYDRMYVFVCNEWGFVKRDFIVEKQIAQILW